jgi:hypothetical protein
LPKPTVCSACGHEGTYAKGLCRNCHARWLRRGTAERLQSKFVGVDSNGWVCLSVNGKHATVRCSHCGEIKKVCYGAIRNASIRPHRCDAQKARHGTARQNEIWSAWIASDRKDADAARALGVSRECVRQVIKLLQRPKPIKDTLEYMLEQLAKLEASREIIVSTIKNKYPEAKI